MQIDRYLTLGAVALLAGTILAAPSVRGASFKGVCTDSQTPGTTLPPCTCTSPSGFSIALSGPATGTDPRVYTYNVSGGGNAKVSAIRQIQVIVPRPVRPN